MILGGLSATLTLPDWGRIARYPPSVQEKLLDEPYEYVVVAKRTAGLNSLEN
jgi:hypothetical protein